MGIVCLSAIFIIANVLFLQALGTPILSQNMLLGLILIIQVLFLVLYFYIKRKNKKFNINKILLHHFGNNNIALYDSKGKLLGKKGDFFTNINPILEIEKRLLKYDFNDPLALSKLQTAILSRSDTTVEMALASSNGETMFTKISVTFFHQSCDYILWRIQDISAERTISEVFRSELKYLSEFMDNLPIGLYLADSAGKIRFVNNSLCEWLGKTYKQIEGTHVSEFTENSQSPDFSGTWQGMLSFKGAFGNFPAFVRHSSYDKGGETMFRSVVIKDVSQSDKANKVLREAEIRFQWIFEENPVGIAFVDTEYSINEGNDALFKLFHSYREKVIGTNLGDYIHPADIEKMDQARGIIITGQERAASAELRIINSSGQAIGTASVFITAMTGLDYSKNSHAYGLVLHFIDTTERNQLAEQFSQAQKMQAMGLMAGGIAHNFNNTLTAIIGFCDLLLQKVDENNPTYQDVKRIKDNALHSASLIKDLLSYSRNQPSKAKVINPVTVIENIYNFIKISVPENIELKTQHARNVGNIFFDEFKLHQIITNLVNNARDAITPAQGHIIIKTRADTFNQPLVIENDTLPAGKYVIIEIEDNGSGILPDVLPKIFDPFFSTKKDSTLSGSGFGLSTALGDVRQAGGFITVDSTVDIGTKFTIYLPEHSKKDDENQSKIKESVIDKTTISEKQVSSPLSVKAKVDIDGQMGFAQIQESLAPKPVVDTSGNAKILFVEDEEAVRAFGVRALRNKGYIVTECACAEDAYDLIEAGETFDLIASDVVMPGMSGTELAEKVKEIIPGIKILLMSGYFADIANIENYNNYFLAKPFSLDQLTTKVKEIIQEN